jgi:hypothetical protein
MWGSCLDHVLEVEVVTADGKIQRASETQNSDLFFVSSFALLPTDLFPRRPYENHQRAKTI